MPTAATGSGTSRSTSPFGIMVEDGDYFHEAITTRLTGPRQALDLALRLRPHGGSIVGVVAIMKDADRGGAELINPGHSSA